MGNTTPHQDQQHTTHQRSENSRRAALRVYQDCSRASQVSSPMPAQRIPGHTCKVPSPILPVIRVILLIIGTLRYKQHSRHFGSTTFVLAVAKSSTLGNLRARQSIPVRAVHASSVPPVQARQFWGHDSNDRIRNISEKRILRFTTTAPPSSSSFTWRCVEMPWMKEYRSDSPVLTTKLPSFAEKCARSAHLQ